MLKQNTEHRTRKQFEVKNTNIKKIQKMGVIFSKRLDSITKTLQRKKINFQNNPEPFLYEKANQFQIPFYLHQAEEQA